MINEDENNIIIDFSRIDLNFVMYSMKSHRHADGANL
jgi:hypothetical protein